MPNMRRVVTRLASTISAASAVGLAAGCSTSGAGASVMPTAADQSTRMTTSPATSAPAQPSTTPPDRKRVSASAPVRASREPGPGLLYDHSHTGAVAYVEDYLGRLNRSWTTPRASLLDNRALTGCGTCSNSRDAAAHLAGIGQRHEDPMLTVTNVSVSIWRPTVHVVADTRQTDHDVVDLKGRKIRSVEGTRAYLYVELVYRGRWWIKEVGIEAVSDDGTYKGP